MGNKNDVLTAKIIDYIDKLYRYTSDVEKDAFLSELKLVEACVFNLLQIGELANRTDEDFQKKNSNIPWHKLRGLRNRLVHDYEGVNLELVWDIIQNDLLQLRCQLHKFYANGS
jgi:uncharacterized protein with HEPN domain